MSLIPDPPNSSPSSPSQRKALGVFALAAVAALVALAAPVSSGLFLGTLLAFSLLGTYERFSTRSKRPVLAAVLLALGSGLAMLGGLFGILYFMVIRGALVAQQLAEGFSFTGTPRTLVQRME